MNRNRNQPASPRYERSLAAIKRIEAHLKPEMDAWEDEKLRRVRLMVFGPEAIEPAENEPAATQSGTNADGLDYEPQIA